MTTTVKWTLTAVDTDNSVVLGKGVFAEGAIDLDLEDRTHDNSPEEVAGGIVAGVFTKGGEAMFHAALYVQDDGQDGFLQGRVLVDITEPETLVGPWLVHVKGRFEVKASVGQKTDIHIPSAA